MIDENGIKHVVDELKQIRLAIASLNPDPKQTIQEYKDNQTLQKRMMIWSAIVSLGAFVVSIVALILTYAKSN